MYIYYRLKFNFHLVALASRNKTHIQNGQRITNTDKEFPLNANFI